MSWKKKPFVLLVIFFAVVLLLLSFWVIRQNSSKRSGSLLIQDVVFSAEADSVVRSAGDVSRFPYGSRQVCIRFNYGKATERSEIRILWFMGDKVIQSDSYTLYASSGSKRYCLIRENGYPLPKGSYSVSIFNKSELISDFRFEIY